MNKDDALEYISITLEAIDLACAEHPSFAYDYEAIRKEIAAGRWNVALKRCKEWYQRTAEAEALPTAEGEIEC